MKNAEVDDDRAVRRLCRLGPLMGAIWLGSLAIVVVWYLPPPYFVPGAWGVVNPVLASVSASVALGAIGGWAYGQSALLELAGQFDLASDICLRWALAGAALFLLLPLANYDYTVRHMASQYLLMLRAYLPCVIAVVLLLARAVGLSRRIIPPGPN